MAKSAGSAAPRPVEAAPPPSGPSHYTKTNVQERGVDEADIVKTDGKFVYTLRNNELLIAKTWPVDKPDIVARLKFKRCSRSSCICAATRSSRRATQRSRARIRIRTARRACS